MLIRFVHYRWSPKFDKLRQRITAASIIYEPGDEILVHIKNRKKLSMDQRRWMGPYTVISSDGAIVTYTDETGTKREKHNSHVKFFHRREIINPTAAMACATAAEGDMEHKSTVITVHGWNAKDVEVIKTIDLPDDTIVTIKLQGYPFSDFYLSRNPELKYLL